MFELEFGNLKELRERAANLNGKTVLVVGKLEIRKRGEMEDRKIVSIARIEEAERK